MRVLKSLLVVVTGAMVGIVAALIMCPVPDSMAMPSTIRDRAIFILNVALLAGISVGAFLGGLGAYRLYWHPTRTESDKPLTHDAQKEARAKFLPSTDTTAEHGAIHPYKQGLTAEDH